MTIAYDFKIGASVLTVEGEVGRLRSVVVDPESDVVTQLVVRRGRLLRHTIVLRGTREDLGHLHASTPPHSDGAFAAAVVEMLQRQGGEALRPVQVQVDRGLASLHGTGPTMADKAQAEQLARSGHGVIVGRNALQACTTIAARVAAALAEDPRAALAPIDVSSSAATMALIGPVVSGEVRETAERIARLVPGVVRVLNALEVYPHDLDIEPLVPAWLDMPR